MNDTISSHEQLSALIDGELPRDELRFLLKRLERDGELAQRWNRYQLISQTLKRERALQLASDRFADAVMQRLDASQHAAAAAAPLGRRMLRWAGGGAIAASVAAFALLATRPATDNGAAAGLTPATSQVAAAAPAADGRAVPSQQPPQQLLPAGFADYAQPASFESIVPNYVPRNQGGQLVNGLSDGFVPYVLVVGSRQMLEPQPGTRRDPAQQ